MPQFSTKIQKLIATSSYRNVYKNASNTKPTKEYCSGPACYIPYSYNLAAGFINFMQQRETEKKRATKLIPEIRNQSYIQRIQDLDLITLV